MYLHEERALTADATTRWREGTQEGAVVGTVDLPHVSEGRPLLAAQLGVWFASASADPTGSTFNVGDYIAFEGAVRPDLIEAAHALGRGGKRQPCPAGAGVFQGSAQLQPQPGDLDRQAAQHGHLPCPADPPRRCRAEEDDADLTSAGQQRDASTVRICAGGVPGQVDVLAGWAAGQPDKQAERRVAEDGAHQAFGALRFGPAVTHGLTDTNNRRGTAWNA